MLIFILMGAVSASENITDSSTNNDAVTGDVVASPDNSQTSSVANSDNNNVGNVTNVTKNNTNSNLLTSPNNGGGDVLGAPDDSFTALQSLINGAASGSTLILDRNYKFYADYDSAYVVGVLIKNPLTINGNGYSIDASNSARVFKLTNKVTVNNLTFVNAYVNGSGGAVYAPKVEIPGAALDSWDDIRCWSYTNVKDYTLRNDGLLYLEIDTNNGVSTMYQDNIMFDEISKLRFNYGFDYVHGNPTSYTIRVYAGDTLLYSRSAYLSNGFEGFKTYNIDCSKITGA